MIFDDFTLVRLTQEHVIKPFDCGDEDLNEFFKKDSKPHQEHLLTVTYVLESDLETVAFFSLLNDKISLEVKEINSAQKRVWNRINRRIPNGKRKHSYPSMKIGRLGVSSNFQNKQIGTGLLDYIKGLFINNNRTGCRFITLDGYKQSLKFYEQNGFEYLTEADINDDTRLMYFDLSKL